MVDSWDVTFVAWGGALGDTPEIMTLRKIASVLQRTYLNLPGVKRWERLAILQVTGDEAELMPVSVRAREEAQFGPYLQRRFDIVDQHGDPLYSSHYYVD